MPCPRPRRGVREERKIIKAVGFSIKSREVEALDRLMQEVKRNPVTVLELRQKLIARKIAKTPEHADAIVKELKRIGGMYDGMGTKYKLKKIGKNVNKEPVYKVKEWMYGGSEF